MKLGKRFKLLTIVLIVVLLTLGAPLLAYGGDKETLAEVRELLRNSYVEVVSEDVLSAPTINEMLRKLGDEHTQYLPKAEHDQSKYFG
jgi:carboxyl-terminal processing protease